MLLQEITNLVKGTSDPAFAVDGTGQIVAWNVAAEAFFPLPAAEAIGKFCREVLRGVDECGPVCSTQCIVQQALQDGHPISNFDLQVKTTNGNQWCNVSVMLSGESRSTERYAIHIVRQIDMQKRLELAVRDFVVTGTGLPAEQAAALLSTDRGPARATELSQRESVVLRLLAKGVSSTAIADELHISRSTVHNHVQHILRKLNAHTRLEAIRRAEHAGLV